MIPVSTTTVTARRVSEPEPGEGQSVALLARGVRAVISTPTGTEQAAPGGGSEQIDAVLIADPIAGLAHTDRVVDDADGSSYEVAWVTSRRGLGVDHTRAGLVRVTGRTAP
jgi:hypothetical protein